MDSITSDRFIPNRHGMNVDYSHHSVTQTETQKYRSVEHQPESMLSPNTHASYTNTMNEQLCQDGYKILAFQTKAPAPKTGHQSSSKVLFTYSQGHSGVSKKAKQSTRHIPQTAEKILDAPGLMDDFYLNVLDWSVGNTLAIGLEKDIFLLNATTGDIQQISPIQSAEGYVSSVSWAADGVHLAVGTSDNEIQLWDVQAGRKLRTMGGHNARVSCLTWNNGIITSSGRDAAILNHDVSQRQHVISRFLGHEREVCGLKWSANKSQLASGANDNRVNIYDARNLAAGYEVEPTFSFTDHQAAVKAVAWAPFQNDLLATGGGTADRCIKFWNTTSGTLLDSVDTESQVCSLVWSKTSRELVSSHGFARNQICVWKYPSLLRIAELTGHSSRVLHTALSPDGCTVASAAGDETLRLWKVFEPVASKSLGQKVGSASSLPQQSHSSKSQMRTIIR